MPKVDHGFREIETFTPRNSYHSCFALNGKRLEHGEAIDLLAGQTVYKTKVRVRTGHHQGRGGMDESYSWETISCVISLDGTELEVELKPGMKIRRRP